MGKHKHLQNYHLYLGLGGILAVSALVVALTFGLSSAQTMSPPPTTIMPPPGDTGTIMPPPGNTGTYMPPSGDTGTIMPPPGTTGTIMPPPGNTGTIMPPPGNTGTYMPPPAGNQGTYLTPQPGMTNVPTGQQGCTGQSPACTGGQYSFCDMSTAAPTWKCQSPMSPTNGQYPQGTQPSGQYGTQQSGQIQPQPYNTQPQYQPQPGQMSGQFGTQQSGQTQPQPGNQMGQFGQGMPGQGQFGQGMPGGQPGGYQQPQQTQCNPDSRPTPDGRCELIQGFYSPKDLFFGPPQQMMGQGQNGQQNEEFMQKQQAQQEEQFKKMQEKQIAQIKKDLSRMKKEIDRVRKQLDKVTVTENTPEEIKAAKDALVEIDDAMANVETCSGDECFDIMPEVGPLMGDIMNPSVMDALMRLKEGPKFAKRLKTQVTSIVKKATNEAKSLSKKAGRIKDADVEDAVVAKITEAVDQCKTLSEEIIASADEGDIETAADRTQNELQDTCGAVSELRWTIDGLVNKAKVIKALNREIKSFTKQYAKFVDQAKNGKFKGDNNILGALNATLAELTAKVDEIRNERDIDMLEDMYSEVADLIDDAQGYIEDASTENSANQFLNLVPQAQTTVPDGSASE